MQWPAANTNKCPLLSSQTQLVAYAVASFGSLLYSLRYARISPLVSMPRQESSREFSWKIEPLDPVALLFPRTIHREPENDGEPCSEKQSSYNFCRDSTMFRGFKKDAIEPPLDARKKDSLMISPCHAFWCLGKWECDQLPAVSIFNERERTFFRRVDIYYEGRITTNNE